MSGIDAVVDAVVAVLAGVGSFFFLIGTVGILRLPDFYCRTHAATKCDTIGAGSILLALAIFSRFHPESLKIITLAVLVLLSSPTAGHALSRAAYRTGLKPWLKVGARGGGS